jgi:glucuronokinase
MDFERSLIEQRGYGRYEPLDPALLQNVYVAYRRSLSEGTEVFHNNIRARFDANDPAVVQAMRTWAQLAQDGRQALLDGDQDALGKLIDRNFDLRASLYRISDGNMEMIREARSAGASAKFAGSGGAIVGAYRDDGHFQDLKRRMAAINVEVVQPKL